MNEQFVTYGLPYVLLPGNTVSMDFTGNTDWTSTDVDNALCGLVLTGTPNGALDITGLTMPGAAGMVALAALIADGWTITWDGPIITQQPKFIVNVDNSYKLQVASNGSATTYQWQVFTDDWNDIDGATTDTLDNPDFAVPGAFGSGKNEAYRCVITRGARPANSQPGYVDIPFPVAVADGSAHYSGGDLTATAGVFTNDVGALLLGGFAYAPAGSTWQWYLDDVAIDGATGTTPDFNNDPNAGTDGDTAHNVPAPGPTVADAGHYGIKITAPSGLIVSSSIVSVAGSASGNWTVADPFIQTQPSFNEGFLGINGLAAFGSGTLSYQWYLGDSGDTSTPIDGETNSQIGGGGLDAGSYWCRVTGDNGNVDTDAVVISLPVIDSLDIEGDDAVVAAHGSPSDLIYQWYVGASPETATPIDGATTATLAGAAVTYSSQNIWVRVANSVGSTDSDTLNVP